MILRKPLAIDQHSITSMAQANELFRQGLMLKRSWKKCRHYFEALARRERWESKCLMVAEIDPWDEVIAELAQAQDTPPVSPVHTNDTGPATTLFVAT